ncbi:MAG: nuclear transport factor 2 family protein, partial [Bacteroidota bacterium]
NDKIIEHWDVISAYTGSTPSGHTEVDGPTEVTDLDKTEENKALVRNLIQDALMVGGDPSRIPEYVAEEYIQHNKEVPDGREYFLALATAPNRPLNYKRIVLLVGQGNFVATLCEANWNDGTLNQDYAQVDIFRIADGKVVERWDNVEPVPENDVNGGKF